VNGSPAPSRMSPPIGSGIAASLKRMAVDILSGWIFLAVYFATDNIYLATAVGVAIGLAQTFWMISHRRKVDPMQWMALVLVVGLGSATILTRKPEFIVFKPSIMESCFGFMMLRPGWLLRYAPSRSRELIPGLLFVWGYVWAAAWFALAASNLIVAHVYGLKAWAVYTNFTPFLLAPALMGLGALVFPPVVRRVAHAREIAVSSGRVGS
jgi:intracellular septation protein